MRARAFERFLPGELMELTFGVLTLTLTQIPPGLKQIKPGGRQIVGINAPLLILPRGPGRPVGRRAPGPQMTQTHIGCDALHWQTCPWPLHRKRVLCRESPHV